MRLLASALIATMVTIVPVAAQQPTPVQHPYGLDPYNPTDAALLRNYGASLVANTPLLELRKLDPYKPSDAALLRQLGGAIPFWGWWWFPVPSASGPFFPAEGFGPLTPFHGGEPHGRQSGSRGYAGVPAQPRTAASPVRSDDSPPQPAAQPLMTVCTITMGNRVFSCL